MVSLRSRMTSGSSQALVSSSNFLMGGIGLSPCHNSYLLLSSSNSSVLTSDFSLSKNSLMPSLPY